MKNNRLVFSDIHIELMENSLSKETLEIALFNKLRQWLLKVDENNKIIDIYVPWDFVIKSLELWDLESYSKLLLKTFFEKVLKFVDCLGFKVNNFFFCLWNHDYYFRPRRYYERKNSTDFEFEEKIDYVDVLKWNKEHEILEYMKEIGEEVLKAKNSIALEWETFYDETNKELVLWNMLFSLCESFDQNSYARLNDFMHLTPHFLHYDNEYRDREYLFPLLDTKIILEDERLTWLSWLKEIIQTFENKEETYKSDKLHYKPHYKEYPEFLFYWNYLSLITSLCLHKDKKIDTLTFLLHFPFDYNIDSFEQTKKIKRWIKWVDNEYYERNNLTSYFNVNMIWYERLLEVIKIIFPQIKNIYFYCWHTHQFDEIILQEWNVEVMIVNNSLWYYWREWGTK